MLGNSSKGKGLSELLEPEIILLDEWKIPFAPPWGDIYKSETLTKRMFQDEEMIREKLELDNSFTSSVAIGKMEAGAFHSPYIRHASKPDINEKQCKRVYKVLHGSFICVRNGKMEEHFPNSDYIIVREDDLFSFKAGNGGVYSRFLIFLLSSLEQIKIMLFNSSYKLYT